MSLTDLTIQAFLDKTAGNEPVPGGGSISALCGALAASLAEMVTRLTIGRKKYADVEERMQELSARFATIRQEMARYIDRDAEAYDRVFQAFKLPKETEEEKEWLEKLLKSHEASPTFLVYQRQRRHLNRCIGSDKQPPACPLLQRLRNGRCD